MNLFENLQLLKESENKFSLIIKIFSHINTDGFNIEVYNGDDKILSKEYNYGYNASYNKVFSSNSKPYTGDIIQNYINKYKPNNINVIQGENSFSSKNVPKDQVDNFIKKYMPNIKINKE